MKIHRRTAEAIVKATSQGYIKLKTTSDRQLERHRKDNRKDRQKCKQKEPLEGNHTQ
jgi:hypothetical protein